nr:OmpA family protein [uncultured Amphritea sp.]
MLVKPLFIVCLSASFLLLSGCSNTPNYLVGPEETIQENTVSTSINKTELIVYRTDNDADNFIDSSVLITHDGRVVGGLMPGQYLVSNICFGENEVTLKTIKDIKQSLTFQSVPDQSEFIKIVSASKGTIQFERVSETVAADELSDLEHRSFLANRSFPQCVREKEIILKEVNLNADALFEFDGAMLVDLIAKDRLDELVKEVSTFDLKSNRVVIVGYADRLGNDAYNQSLSEARAQTIASYLISHGMPGDIQAVGFGSAEPVTTSCSDSLMRKELIQCLQPDRRVSVQLRGRYESLSE